MSKEIELEIDIASVRRLLFKHRFGKIIGTVGGEATLKFTPPTDSDTEKAGRQLGDGIVEMLLSRRTVSLSRDSVGISIAGDVVTIEFSKENIVSISFDVPINITRLDLSKLDTKQNVKGTAEISVVLSLEFIPDYRRIASRQSRKAVQEILRKQSHKIVRLTQRGRRIGKIAFHYGRRAISAPFRKLADTLARNLAKNAIKLGSQTAALRKLLRGLGKLAGAAGIVFDAYLIAQEQLPVQVARVGKKTRDLMHPTWANAYGELLAAMTDSNWTASSNNFFELEITVQRLAGPIPNIYGSYQRLTQTGELARPTQNASDWRDGIVNNGAKVIRQKLLLAEIDWTDLYSEAFNVYFVFADAALHASGSNLKKRAFEMSRHADHLTKVSGLVAAYHDIVNFVYASGVYADNGNVIDPDTVWEDWPDIVALHQAYYGAKFQDRLNWYVHLTTQGLDVRVLPFSDFAQTVTTPKSAVTE